MAPRVSVVMASYNHGRFVGEAIDSVLSQNYTDFEFVIVDDGSRDDSVSVIRSRSDSRIVFEPFERNRGACEATNRALELARGEFVAILNSDDRFVPGKLERQVAFLDAHPEVIATFGLPRPVDEEGRRLGRRAASFARPFEAAGLDRVAQVRRLFDRGNFFCHPTMMARRSLYERCGGYDPLLRQLPDYDMWCRAIGLGELHVAAEELVEFRILRDGGNVSASNVPAIRRMHWETVRVLERFSDLPADLLEAAFADRVPERFRDAGFSWPVKLAMIAAETDSSAHQVFAVETLERACRAGEPGVTTLLLHDLRGRIDPFRIPAARPFRVWRRKMKARLKSVVGLGR